MAPDLRSSKKTYCDCKEPDGCPQCRCSECGRWLLMYEEAICIICQDRIDMEESNG